MGKQLRMSVSDVEFNIVQQIAQHWGRLESDIALDIFRKGLPVIMEENAAAIAKNMRLQAAFNQRYDYTSLSQAITCNLDTLLQTRIDPQRLAAIRDGKVTPDPLELARLALALGVSEEYLENLPLNGGTHHASIS